MEKLNLLNIAKFGLADSLCKRSDFLIKKLIAEFQCNVRKLHLRVRQWASLRHGLGDETALQGRVASVEKLCQGVPCAVRGGS